MINGLKVLICPVLLLCLFPVRLQSLTSDCICGVRVPSGEVTLISLKCWAAAGGETSAARSGAEPASNWPAWFGWHCFATSECLRAVWAQLSECPWKEWVISFMGHISDVSGVAWPCGVV